MNHLKELCQDLELTPHLEKSKEGGSIFPFHESLRVEIRDLNPGVFFFSPICPCPEIKREILFIQLMKANLFGQGTMWAAIAFDEGENLLTLSSGFPYDMDYRSFKESLEDFANIVEYWREEVAHHVDLAEGGIL